MKTFYPPIYDHCYYPDNIIPDFPWAYIVYACFIFYKNNIKLYILF